MERLQESAVVVLTDGYDLYERLRRGVYHKLDRRGHRTGSIHTHFRPRPRWKPARVCVYDASVSLTCENCGAYDNGYAATGVRSFCWNQGKGW